MFRHVQRASVVLLMLLLLPVAASAQDSASISGVVKDKAGAVMPGVTVEAASPVLIEKVRSVVADGTGRYRIVDLPPGTYSVTFKAAGFSTAIQEGIELSGSFAATINSVMVKGAPGETIKVTAEVQTVDTQSTKAQQTVSKDTLSAIPSSRTALGIQSLIPGLSQTSDGGGATATVGSGTAGTVHGGRADDSNMMQNNLTTTWQGGGGGGGNNANTAGAQEIIISTGGGLAEVGKAGVTINLIPRQGANNFSGTLNLSGANGSMQGSNYTPALQAAGLTSPQKIVNNYDFNPMGGGRIIRDRLWFYNTLRIWGSTNTVPGIFTNRNAGDPTKWNWDPDPSKPAQADLQNGTAIGNITWQVTRRNKVNLYWSEQWNLGNTGNQGGTAPTTAIEATGKIWYRPSRVQQVAWSSPLTSRILLEAGFGTYEARYRQGGAPREDGSYNPLMINVVEQAGVIPGLSYRAPAQYNYNTIGTHTWHADVSYVTGRQNLKFGYFGGFLNPKVDSWNTQSNGVYSYRFRNGVPNQLSERIADPIGNGNISLNFTRQGWPTAFYGQDQMSFGKLTLQGGLRYDHYETTYPLQQAVASPYLVPTVFPAGSTPGLNWHDVTPRFGAAYDLFGNGKTALKFNIGRYPNAIIVQDATLDPNPLARLALTTNRTWTDSNHNFIPDCNLGNSAANLECGADSNLNFGTTKFSSTFDPAMTTGWGTRPYQWDSGIAVSHQIRPRMSVTAGFYRRWYGNFYVVDNLSAAASDYNPYTITVNDPRLPGGTATAVGYDLNPSKFGQTNNYVTKASNYGTESENWQGVDVNFTARLSKLSVQGGTNTGRRSTDTCAVTAQVPESLFQQSTLGVWGAVNTNFWAPASNCRNVEPYITQVRGLASYTVWKGIVVSATLQSNPGPQQVANYTIPNATVAPLLGRNLSGGAATTGLNIVNSGNLYGPRFNQIDLGFGKTMKFGRVRSRVKLDIFNINNTAVPLTYNNNFTPAGGPWLVPATIINARWAKVGAQFDF